MALDRAVLESRDPRDLCNGELVEVIQREQGALQGRQGIDGGCIVWQQDRHALYDNTFASILGRQKERLRPIIAAWLWGDEGHWQE